MTASSWQTCGWAQSVSIQLHSVPQAGLSTVLEGPKLLAGCVSPVTLHILSQLASQALLVVLQHSVKCIYNIYNTSLSVVFNHTSPIASQPLAPMNNCRPGCDQVADSDCRAALA